MHKERDRDKTMVECPRFAGDVFEDQRHLLAGVDVLEAGLPCIAASRASRANEAGGGSGVRPGHAANAGRIRSNVAILLAGVGYIGAALLRQIASRQDEGERRAASAGPIVALDDFSSTARDQVFAALPPATRLVDGDVANPSAVARAFDRLDEAGAAEGDRPTVVYHLAAQPSAAIAARDPERTERSNLSGARVLLQEAHSRGARVVFGGSFRVYGDELVGRTIDEHTAYGRVGDLSHLSKVYVEQLARMIGVAFVSVRLGVTYGLSPIMKSAPELMTVPNLFCKRACAGEVLRVLEDRPMAFIHVDDAASALLDAAELIERNGSDGAWRAVNAAPEVATIGQVARAVQRLMRARGQEVPIEGEAASEATFGVNSTLHTSPRHTLEHDLDAVIDYFLARQ